MGECKKIEQEAVKNPLQGSVLLFFQKKVSGKILAE